MFEAFINLLFPRTCYACYQPLESAEQIICTKCHLDLPKTNSHLEPLPELRHKFLGKVEVKYAFSYLKFVKGGKIQRLMHELKYRGKQEIGETLGRWYGGDLRESGFSGEFDMILTVPLHKKRLRERGYNQSDCFAKGLSESLGVMWDGSILIRTKKTDSQISKTRTERFLNMEDVFVVSDSADLRRKRILLVDDTITTGATLEACIIALRKADVSEISVVTIAMVI